MHSDQFKPKSNLKLIKKYIFSEGEQFPLNQSDAQTKTGSFNAKQDMQMVKQSMPNELACLEYGIQIWTLSTV